MDLISARSAICDWLPMWGKIPKHALPRVHEALRALIQSHGGIDWVNARAGCRVVKRQVFRSGSFRNDFYDDIAEHLQYEEKDIYIREHHAQQLVA